MQEISSLNSTPSNSVGRAVQQHDVAQMEIAVTLPNETGLAPPLEHLRTTIELATRVVSHAIRCRRIQTPSPELGEPGGVSFNDPGHARLAAVIRAMLGGLVKVGDCRRQRRHELDAKGADRCQSIEQCLLRKPIHLHEPVDGRAVPPERIRAVVLAGDGDDSTIERRRRPPVEANFRLAQACGGARTSRSRDSRTARPASACTRAHPRERRWMRACQFAQPSRRRVWMAQPGTR